MQSNYKMTLRQWHEFIARPFKVSKNKLKGTGRPLDKYVVEVYNQESKQYKSYKLEAYTKGEARAQLKKLLGVSKLPAGLNIRKVENG
jgi:hypothetical protein